VAVKTLADGELLEEAVNANAVGKPEPSSKGDFEGVSGDGFQ